MIRAALLLLTLFLLSVAFPAAAQTQVHRCVGKDGGPVFTDQPCGNLGARSIAPPAAASSTEAPAGTSPSTGLLCAKDMATLRVAVASAFNQRDANRIGGLTLWSGYGSGGAVENIRNLEAVVKQTLLSLEGDEADGITAVTRVPGGGEASHQVHFGVVRDAGCLWLRPPA
ncbi:DUF4124 domain-containing protein [Luteibacter pinisoli]|uniref:DUF4124 domain-containing protein n=1 Tax=Luteibacter pinisoli TaxID=2589080 RepID=UPI001FE63B32|nr:DUF4124 domain-containing protein [Luteibacter pinisoli]